MIATHKLRRWLIIRKLYLMHWLTRQRIQLHTISKPPGILFSGTSLALCWRVSGCHRIVINNRLVLPGNATSVELGPSFLSGVLQICFEGSKQAIEKIYEIRPVYLQPKQLTVASIKEPASPSLKMYEKPGLCLFPKTGRVALPSPVFRFPLRLMPQSRPAFSHAKTLRCPSHHIQLEPCKLPQLLN